MSLRAQLGQNIAEPLIRHVILRMVHQEFWIGARDLAYAEASLRIGVDVSNKSRSIDLPVMRDSLLETWGVFKAIGRGWSNSDIVLSVSSEKIP
jgi:hypothetical protein